MDDGDFPFEDREQLTEGVQLISDHLKRFGLDMHIRRGTKMSKTECVFFPPPGFFRRKQILPAQENGGIDTLIEKVIVVKESHEGKCRREEREYVLLAETRLIVVSDGFVSFCPHLKYLGSWLSFSLRDDYDVERQIGAANASMGALDNFWKDHNVVMYSKYMIFRVIPCNLILWVCKSWALCQTFLNKLEVFLHSSIRRILNINMVQGRERHIKNSHIRVMFYNIPCVRNQVAFRKLIYVGKVLCCEESHVPTILLTAWCNNPRKRGGQLLTNKDSLVCNLRLIILSIDDAGSVST